MAIEIEQEDVEELKKWGLGLSRVLEHCYFCKTSTTTWHRASNTPICESCGSSCDRADIARKDIARPAPMAAI